MKEAAPIVIITSRDPCVRVTVIYRLSDTIRKRHTCLYTERGKLIPDSDGGVLLANLDKSGSPMMFRSEEEVFAFLHGAYV